MEPICDSMARAISDFTFTGAPPASFHSSVCLPPTDAPQRGSLSDSQGVRKEQQRRPQTRSKNGCWTCRKRRVKCDEVRPQCGGCVRLYKNCHYGYQWQLLDFGLCTGRQLRHNTPSSSSSWNRYPSSLTSDTQSTRPSFKHRNVSGISPEDTHRKKDAPSPQDSYSISTNSSFSSPSSCRPLTPLSHVTSPDEIDQDKRMRVSDFGILAKPETSSQPTLLLPRSLWNKYELPESAGSQQTPSAPRDSEDQNTVTAAEPMLNHKALTLPHIATYGLRYHDEELGAFDEEAAIFTHSKSFEPVS